MGKQRRSQHPQSWMSWVGAAVVAFIAVFAFQGEVEAQATFASGDDAAPVTYAADVAEIINENCVNCHREGGIGPMQLTNYEQVQQWAPLIKMRVANRDMPPYAYDTNIGIQDLDYDWRLSQEEINTVVQWVDEGAPMGDPADMPPAPDLPDPNEWNFTDRFGPPDLIVPSTPVDVPAAGNDMWHRPYVPTGLTEDRCIQAVQVRPA
ncbi:MAG: cytochrome c, partial [Longimicrobiales bacterium]|nr:cytochrome c [Longimicrobiales bacterium]